MDIKFLILVRKAGRSPLCRLSFTFLGYVVTDDGGGERTGMTQKEHIKLLFWLRPSPTYRAKGDPIPTGMKILLDYLRTTLLVVQVL